MTALLFDLDGTLVDSDGDHLIAFQKVFAPLGIALDRPTYTAQIMGASNAMIGARFLARPGDRHGEQSEAIRPPRDAEVCGLTRIAHAYAKAGRRCVWLDGWIASLRSQ